MRLRDINNKVILISTGKYRFKLQNIESLRCTPKAIIVNQLYFNFKKIDMNLEKHYCCPATITVRPLKQHTPHQTEWSSDEVSSVRSQEPWMGLCPLAALQVGSAVHRVGNKSSGPANL